MSQTAYDAYLEGNILSADPIRLVRMLYEGATDAVREARRRLAEGDIAGRARSISNAFDILAELMTSLDPENGAEMAKRLGLLYDYMQRQLIEANTKQEDAPLAEVLGLLATMTEAWAGVEEQTRPTAPAASPWGQPEAEAELAGAGSHAWSF